MLLEFMFEYDFSQKKQYNFSCQKFHQQKKINSTNNDGVVTWSENVKEKQTTPGDLKQKNCLKNHFARKDDD